VSAIAAAADQLTIGLDVGGTKTAVVVTDAAGDLVHETVQPTTAAHLTDQLVAMARAARAAAEVARPGSDVAAIGVAAPGRVDPATGTVDLAVNLGADQLDVAAPIERQLGLPCFVEHDARAAAIWLADQADGADDGTPPSLAYLSVGTGIAAGIVIDGKPLRGRRGLAGEVGHVVADPAGPRCTCGLRGCLEAVAAGPALARLANAAAERKGGPRVTSAEDVFRSADAGDAGARRVIDGAVGHLARAIRGLVLAFGVERVIIGGGVAGAGDALLGPLLDAIAIERQASALAEQALSETSIELLPPQSAAGARGAALVARRAFASTPTAVAVGGRG
jgi:glucokinase